jgi:predicted Zn-dependent peptidase
MTYLYKDGEKIDYGEVKKLIEGVRNEDIRNVISKMLKNAAYERISFT